MGYKRTFKLPLLHLIDITQIISLSDFESRLQFVSVGLDCIIKVIQIEDNEEVPASVQYEQLSNGQIINALSLHGLTSLFAVSTFNEETELNYI